MIGGIYLPGGEKKAWRRARRWGITTGMQLMRQVDYKFLSHYHK